MEVMMKSFQLLWLCAVITTEYLTCLLGDCF